ncbi:MAG: hypothetical protein ACOX3T_01480 [Bdellovibrionota bacterium]|jgi:polyhydroxyalkanoate synthesis regulator phasin
MPTVSNPNAQVGDKILYENVEKILTTMVKEGRLRKGDLNEFFFSLIKGSELEEIANKALKSLSSAFSDKLKFKRESEDREWRRKRRRWIFAENS